MLVQHLFSQEICSQVCAETVVKKIPALAVIGGGEGRRGGGGKWVCIHVIEGESVYVFICKSMCIRGVQSVSQFV